jgi:hypothetical protein
MCRGEGAREAVLSVLAGTKALPHSTNEALALLAAISEASLVADH